MLPTQLATHFYVYALLTKKINKIPGHRSILSPFYESWVDGQGQGGGTFLLKVKAGGPDTVQSKEGSSVFLSLLQNAPLVYI